MTDTLAVSVAGLDDELVAALVGERVASRIAAGDASVWGPAAQEEAAVRLGWVHLYETSRPLLAEIEALVADLRADGLDRVVLCGMGGSSLAPEVITRTAGVELTVLDTTDPAAIRRAVGDRLDRTVVVVSSKSGSTVETDSQRRAFEAAFRAAAIEPGPRLVAVTDEGSVLAEHAVESGFRRVFLADQTVGGRYSALTAFGLVPSALAGVDVSALLDEAAAAAPSLLSDDAANPALLLGAALAGGVAQGRDKVAIADAGSGILGFAEWAEQLVAESTGKEGKGLLPVALSGVDDPEIRWPAGDVLPVVVGSTHVGTDVGVAVRGPLGAQFLLWEYATAVAGRVIGINPFDQPDVESAKLAARGLLDARPESEPATFVDGVVEGRGTPGLLDGVDTVAGAVSALFDRLDEHGYVAVMAYLDRQGDDAALAGVRRPIASRTERPVTFGWGPRFLHSTGQYHKGGPATGVYLQVTGETLDDVPVPDRPFTFGELIAAQAAGDAQVLAGHGRPVLRLHLTDRKAGVAQLLEALR
ncbi:MAG: glucose-6-phosphate isomerase [Jiangellaceae bacterium]